MEKCRVNRITVNVDKRADDTIISLYKTNTILGIINADDLEIESFQKSGVSLKAYQAYCKDIVINLLDNGGISGYYYDPKEERTGQKYGVSEFGTSCIEYITGLIGDRYEWKRNYDDDISEMEQYNDKYIKNAKGSFGISIVGFDIKLHVIAEIKSGQMCRPKIFVYNNTEYTLNITNINRVVKLS